MQEASKLRDQSAEELKALSLDLSKEIYRLKNEIRTTKKVEKPHLLKQLKRDRARVLTVLSEKGASK